MALFGVGAYYLISERAYDRLDRSLNDTADARRAGAGRSRCRRPRLREPPTAGDPAQPTPSASADPAGTRVELDPLGKTPPSGPRTVVLQGERYRLLVRALPVGTDGSRRTVAVARPLTDVEQTLDEVALGLGIAALVAAALATGLALLIVRGALRPLAQARRRPRTSPTARTPRCGCPRAGPTRSAAWPAR